MRDSNQNNQAPRLSPQALEEIRLTLYSLIIFKRRTSNLEEFKAELPTLKINDKEVGEHESETVRKLYDALEMFLDKRKADDITWGETFKAALLFVVKFCLTAGILPVAEYINDKSYIVESARAEKNRKAIEEATTEVKTFVEKVLLEATHKPTLEFLQSFNF
jgi:hypothetical protein